MGVTTSFYAPPDHVRGGFVRLPESEAEHASRVLRLEAGAEVEVVDGEGTWYRVHLEEVTPDRTAGRVLDRETERAEPPYHLELAVGLLKKRSRLETMLEKAVELGAAAVRPLLTRRTETDRLRRDRCRRVMVAALKQSRRCRLPVVAEPVDLETYLSEPDRSEAVGGEGEEVLRLLAHQPEDGVDGLRAALPAEAPALVRTLVGPEGGFAPGEVRLAEAHGYRRVHLGRRRLRGETAAVAVAAALGVRYE